MNFLLEENKWSFHIASGWSPTLESMRPWLGKNNDTFSFYSVENDNGKNYFFSSSFLDCLDDPSEIYTVASQLIRLINGFLFFVFKSDDDYCEVILGDLYNSSDYRRSTDRKHVPSKFNIIGFAESKMISIYNVQHEVLELSKSDLNIRDVFYIIGAARSFQNFYKVLDVFSDMEGGKKLLEKSVGKSLTSRINDFGNAANSFDALGIEARHRKRASKPFEKDITLTDAKNLMIDLFDFILHKHYNIALSHVEPIDRSFGFEELF